MPHSVPSKRAAGLPPLLAHVIRALENDARRDARRTSGRRASALSELAQLFMVVLPVRGLDPVDDLREEIERIATRHLRRGEAEAQFRSAVDRIASVKDRDAIETAHGQLVESTELAHYYAGIAAGITLAELGRTPR
jgi:hypothetical protein